MRRRTFAVALAVAATIAVGNALPAHAARRYVATYVPGVWVGCDARSTADWYAGMVVDPSAVPCMGAVNHVPVSHLDRKVDVRIEDATSAPIGGALRFYDQEGNALRIRDARGNVWRELPFCGRVASAVPPGAARLTTGLHSDACGESGGVPTTGTVVASFT